MWHPFQAVPSRDTQSRFSGGNGLGWQLGIVFSVFLMLPRAQKGATMWLESHSMMATCAVHFLHGLIYNHRAVGERRRKLVIIIM